METTTSIGDFTGHSALHPNLYTRVGLGTLYNLKPYGSIRIIQGLRVVQLLKVCSNLPT